MKLTKKEKKFIHKCFDIGLMLVKAANSVEVVGVEKTVSEILLDFDIDEAIKMQGQFMEDCKLLGFKEQSKVFKSVRDLLIKKKGDKK